MAKQLYKVTKKPHHIDRFSVKTGLSGFQFCVNCGLILLKNSATQKAYAKQCIIKEDI